MADSYLNFIVSTHNHYNRYHDDWKLCLNSWYGGVEYKNAKYLRAYAVDLNTPGETINTYITGDDGITIGKSPARLQMANSTYEANKDTDLQTGNFYKEKLDNTPLYNYVKLIAAEYNALLFRNPPQRYVGDSPEAEQFLDDVSGEGESVNEFMSQVDLYTTIMGVCHVTCIKPAGSDIPRWRIHTPLEVTNWKYSYDVDGNLVLTDVVILLEKNDMHSVYRYFTRNEIHTIFVGADDQEDYTPPVEDSRLEQIDDNTFRVVQPNELGYVPIQTFYQSTKIYNNVGTTVIQDVAQIQRSIYGDMAEIYSAITYSAHPTLIVDENTDQLNDGQVGGEPGSIVKVQASLTGQPTHVFEYKSPSLDSIAQIRELVDNKVQKLSQIAMLRSEDLIKAANSGAQIEVYDDKLSAMVRKKATNLENGEAKLWEIWFDWLNMPMPEDFSVSYNRQYNRRALEIELKEVDLMMQMLDKYETLIEGEEEPETESQTASSNAESEDSNNGAACPPATGNVALNLANRQTAIDSAHYGPLNPNQPNEPFWQALADKWSVTVEEAKKSRCGNCAAFIQTSKMKSCIDAGLAAGGATGSEWDTVAAGDLGYCEAWDFKCASNRTCDAWIVGGPITDANAPAEMNNGTMPQETPEAPMESEAEYGLTPEQYAAYEEFKTNARNKIRERLEQLFNASTTDNGF